MDIIANIEKYKRSFNRLSKNPENMFETYLNNNNLTKMDFLFEIGLKKELINEHNFEEINKLISKVLVNDKFPHIEFYYNQETGLKDNIKIYNTDLKNGLTIKDNSVDFIFSDRKNISFVSAISFIYLDNTIRKLETEIENIRSELGVDNNQLTVTAKETNYSHNGEILEENSYKAKIKGKIGMIAYTLLFRSFQKDSIAYGLSTIKELIKRGKLNKENIEFSINDVDVLKK